MQIFFFSVLDNERVVELLQAIKEKTVTLDTIRHAPHPLCKSPPTQISSKLRANEHKHTQLVIPEVMVKVVLIYVMQMKRGFNWSRECEDVK